MMTAHRLLVTCLLALVPVGWAAGEAGSPQAPDVTKLGPQTGQAVPDFALPDQDGRQRSLASVLGPEGAMLVFFRSADW